MVKASLSRMVSTLSLSIPASPDRAAATLSGQLSQVTPLWLFIIPSTKMVTFENSASAAAAFAARERVTEKTSNGMTNNLFRDGIFMIRYLSTCTYYRSKENFAIFVYERLSFLCPSWVDNGPKASLRGQPREYRDFNFDSFRSTLKADQLVKI